MKQAMKKMGISQSDIPNVSEVIIRTRDNEIVITNAQVVCIDMSGTKSYQVTGTDMTRPLTSDPGESVLQIPEDDVQLVMSQTGCTREKAMEALEAVDGQPAEAIIKIVSE
jgi:nascent polypeptide-associated complex subunit alpha